MKKEKILFLVTQAEWGGAQKYVFELASALKGEYEVAVAAGEIADSPELLDRCQSAGIQTYAIKNLVRELNPLRDIRAIFELVRLYKNLKPDIIHLNSSKAGVLGSLAAFFFKSAHYSLLTAHSPKIIYTIHGWAFLEPIGLLRRAIYFLGEWITGRMKNTLIALSEYEKNIGIRLRIAPAARLVVIPHGIDAETQNFLSRDQARKQLATSYKLQTTSPFWIGVIANLYKTKGLDALIRAFALLQTQSAKLQSASLVIVGEGPERFLLERSTRDLELSDRVFLPGTIPDAAQYLKAFDIFVLPSRKEGMPWVLLEAAAAGLPIVATRVGAIPEILQDKKEALLVPPENTKLLAAAILTLAENDMFRASLGAAARERIREFSFSRMLEQTKNVY